MARLTHQIALGSSRQRTFQIRLLSASRREQYPFYEFVEYSRVAARAQVGGHTHRKLRDN